MAEIEEFLKKRKDEGLLRRLKPVERRAGAKIIFNNKDYIDFSSNDYLGLSMHPKLIEEAKKAIGKFGTSSSASRLLSADSPLFHKLEERIARFKNKEAALFFNSGYQANVGIISSLYGNNSCIFLDRLSHASLIDAGLLSQAKLFRFAHNDTGHLESLLKKERDKFKDALIVTESVFSMDGDKAPLKELVLLKEKYNCEIFVDEAHATGVFGKSGAGLTQDEGLGERIDFIMGTFSKALGGFGAYVASSRNAVDYLVNACRSFIYSTAIPPAIIASNLAALDIVELEPFRREKLLEEAGYFRNALRDEGLNVKGESQIIPLIIGDNLRTQKAAGQLQEKGYWVLPIRQPTVPVNEARLRFSLNYYHNREILDKLIDEIKKMRI